MNLSRRGFLGGAALVGLAAPAVITTPGLLMRVRSLFVPRSISTVSQAALTEAQIEAVIKGLMTPSMIGSEIAKIFAQCIVDGGATRVHLDGDGEFQGRYITRDELYQSA